VGSQINCPDNIYQGKANLVNIGAAYDDFHEFGSCGQERIG
jgi:hypothetical protein